MSKLTERRYSRRWLALFQQADALREQLALEADLLDKDAPPALPDAIAEAGMQLTACMAVLSALALEATPSPQAIADAYGLIGAINAIHRRQLERAESGKGETVQ